MGVLRKLAYTTVGGGAILLVGGGLTYRRRLQENKSVTAVEFNAQQDQEALKDCLKHLRDGTLPPVSMYRYTTCPFCCKVKAFFDYYEVPHECVEVDPMFKAQLSGMPYKKVPQLMFHHPERKADPMLVDSDIIVDLMAPLVGAQDQLKDADVDKWRTYARNDLVKLLVINLNATLLGAWNGYNYIDNFDTIPGKNKFFLKAIGGPVMYMVAKYRTTPDLIKQGLLKENATEKERMDALRVAVDRFVDAAAARQVTYKPSKATIAAAKEVTELKTKKMAKEGSTLVQLPSQAALTQSAKLHGVVAPDLADLEVYGVLQSLRGHAIYNVVIQTTRVKPWIDAMDALTGKAPYSASN